MSRRLRRWGIILLICAAVIIPAIILISRWMGSSAGGTVQVGTPLLTTIQNTKPVLVSTPYFTTTLPPAFSIKRQTETPGAQQTLLQLEANTSATRDEQFAATVGTMPSEGLSGVADYNLRATSKAVYTAFSPPSLPAGASAFRNASGPAAFVAFWPHEGKYTELAFSSDGGASLEQLQTLYTGVMASWRWK